MICVTGKQMKAVDNYCIKKLGIPGIVLMENAALKVLKNIDLDKFNSFTIVCGVGNNGGDGLAIGRHLIANDKNVEIFLLGNINKGSNDFNTNYNILKNMGLEIKDIDTKKDINILISSLKNSNMTIDSIFGTGLTRSVEGLYKDVISAINSNSKYVLSIDIPSGMDSDTGNILGISVTANMTVTMQLMKKGLVNNSDYTGKVIVEPIGMPKIAIENVIGQI
ncbi:NAD(P)H-hydrate epimerase [Schnuerera sp. xch1]|uniref:NAD(P)H-hydrate epimerase n=1 Tax=Schnuerera sp. xch1 TaxID=2874283 RepID=UPI001CBA91F4|nr:NAD(P)H-hydrate epimerase [Schnuerera sp. xch1]MBZ2175813.1 NAD(P)H-hydrate epimerase [Schnuerera sp. xch1]